jgi:DNA-binding LytR/AlgR family response regulator
MRHSFIIIDDNIQSLLRTKAIAEGFQNLQFIASASNYDDGLNLILEFNPKIVFLEINPEEESSNLSLQLINELHRYLKEIPKFIITTKNVDQVFEAIKYDVLDYFVKPLDRNELRKSILKFEKALTDIPQFFNQNLTERGLINTEEHKNSINSEVNENNSLEVEKKIDEGFGDNSNGDDFTTSDQIEDNKVAPDVPRYKDIKKEDKPLIICVKSYGDYRFIEAKDICYLQADNNSTDIHLYNGEMITAFKTLKHFEGVLSSPFVRIHNSYIVNIDYVSRIHTGNAVCYIKNTTTKLPFSKSYKENVDSIINSITNGNYLEI